MDYDAAKDGYDSYYAAIEAKRARGDHLRKVIGAAHLYNEDCITVIKSLPDNSIDSVVTDPPYELGFMGKKWDNTGIANSVEMWAEVLRVLKPGGHVVAFSGTRTQHRMVCAIEDSGFEIRDQLGWLYGSGFPKSHDVGNGWGTALKPAWEPICLARKSFKGTVAANVDRHGTGAINIDGCRVATDDKGERAGGRRPDTHEGYQRPGSTMFQDKSDWILPPLGRFPANVIHDGSDEVIAAFPATGKSTGGYAPSGEDTIGYGDSGSAARFFYCAKASRKDRDEGLEGFELKRTGGMSATADGSMLTGSGNERTTVRANTHPTVKPTSLMQYLCRLITPKGGVILDPFFGSGSTGKAAIMEGFSFIGCEREAEYMPIAEARIRHAVEQMAEQPKQWSFL